MGNSDGVPLVWHTEYISIEGLRKLLDEAEKLGRNAICIKSEIYGQGEQDEYTDKWLEAYKVDEALLATPKEYPKVDWHDPRECDRSEDVDIKFEIKPISEFDKNAI